MADQTQRAKLSAKKRAETYDYMREVAHANGFDSITDAITRAVHAERAVDAFLDAGAAHSPAGIVTFGTWSLDKLTKAFALAAHFRTVHPHIVCPDLPEQREG